MATTAAGLASCGKLVYMSTFAMFAPGRCYNQIRNAICYPNLNVKIVSTHGGVTVGEDGSSHQALEDISLTRGIPRMRVYIPCDAKETGEIIKHLASFEGPAYTRVSRMSVPRIYPDEYEFKEEADVLRDGKDVSLIASGLMVQNALDAAELLEKSKIDAEVVNMHTIKPIDKKQIIKSAKSTGAIVTAEEHSVHGGLGSATAEVLVENQPVPMQRIGVQDRFGQSGKPDELMKEYNLTAQDIAKAAKDVIKRRK